MILEEALEGCGDENEREFYCFCCNHSSKQKYMKKEGDIYVFECLECKTTRYYSKNG